jgi:tRNA G10  N-methylase Trm11
MYKRHKSSLQIATEPIGLHEIRPIHPFPARMAPSIAFDELPIAKRPLRVLDPMVGSGTTAVVARAKGHHAIGFDSDPLAVLLTRSWCTGAAPEKVTSVAEDVLKEARRRHRCFKKSEFYPRFSTDATQQFVQYWFDSATRRQLRALSDSIEEITNTAVRDLLWCGLSRLIITKSQGVSLAMDVSHSRPHRVYDSSPITPFEHFLRAVKRVTSNLPFEAQRTDLPHAKVQCHDARRLSLKDSMVDVVITSPPYLNAIDYVRCSKFSLVWMGHQVEDMQTLRSKNIGAERLGSADQVTKARCVLDLLDVGLLPDRLKGLLSKYVVDLDGVLSEISRVLVPRGRAIFVVGDSTLRGVFIRNSEIIKLLGEKHGLRLNKSVTRDLLRSRRYLPPPERSGGSTTLADRMRKEVIMHFTSTKKATSGTSFR